MTARLLAIVVLLMMGLGATAALAQPAPAGQTALHRSPHGDLVDSLPVCSDALKQGCTKDPDKGMALLFWTFAAASVGGALFVVSRKNLIAAVMGMVGSFIGIAAVYMMLYASFLAVVQMLVYAGAIMVLFVFVIMILNRPEDEPVAPTGRAGQGIAGLAIVYLVGRLVMLLVHVAPPNATVANLAPGLTPEGHAWGGVKAVGTDLFNGGIFPFEAISILLLAAVVGAIAVARPLHEIDVPEGTDPNDKRIEGHSV